VRCGRHEVVAARLGELEEFVSHESAYQVPALVLRIGAAKPISHKASARCEAAQTELAPKHVARNLLSSGGCANSIVESKKLHVLKRKVQRRME
jgi:hypothetical protein